MGVRISNTSKPVDRCRMYPIWNMADGTKIFSRSDVLNDRWAANVNLWCPRSSLGRRTCKQRGCCAKLEMLEEVES